MDLKLYQLRFIDGWVWSSISYGSSQETETWLLFQAERDLIWGIRCLQKPWMGWSSRSEASSLVFDFRFIASSWNPDVKELMLPLQPPSMYQAFVRALKHGVCWSPHQSPPPWHNSFGLPFAFHISYQSFSLVQAKSHPGPSCRASPLEGELLQDASLSEGWD